VSGTGTRCEEATPTVLRAAGINMGDEVSGTGPQRGLATRAACDATADVYERWVGTEISAATGNSINIERPVEAWKGADLRGEGVAEAHPAIVPTGSSEGGSSGRRARTQPPCHYLHRR
jgi:hypothetical protein